MLLKFVVDLLKQHLTYQEELHKELGSKWQETGFVFPNGRGGFFNTAQLHKMFKIILEEAELPPIHFHYLRHSAAVPIAR